MRLFIRGDHVAIGLLRLALIVEKVQDDLFLLLRLLRAVLGRGGAARRQHQKRGDHPENGQPFFHRSFPFQMRKRTAAGHRKLYGVRGCPRK